LTQPSTPTSKTADFEAMARQSALVAEDKKATDVLILDMREQSPISDFFVLASVKTRLQARAVANAIDESLDTFEIPRRRQGYSSGSWILMDYGGVVVHIFLEREREYYNLEGLWHQAPVIYRGESSGQV
jgi:ribosome-associated protein